MQDTIPSKNKKMKKKKKKTNPQHMKDRTKEWKNADELSGKKEL